MKKFFKLMFTMLPILVTTFACSDDTLKAIAEPPANGTFLLTADSNQIILNKVNADTNIAVTLSWGGKNLYGIETPVTYTLQMDKVNGNFENPKEVSVITNNTISLTHNELNSKALALNLTPGVAAQIKIRLKANLSYGALPVFSNISTLTITPFDVLVLKFPMPSALFLQGDAVPSNWGTPVTDIQKMVQIDNHRFGLIIALTGGKNFAAISSASTWSDPAYVSLDNFPNPVMTGNFEPRGSSTGWGGSPMKSPTASGVYQLIFDFTTGFYSVLPAFLMAPPAELYIVGNATSNGWAAPGNNQKFTKIDNFSFTLTTTLTAGKFAFISTNTTWSDPAYIGRTDAEPSLAGNIIPSGAANNWAGHNINAPNPGTYTITVNFKSGTYVLKL